MEEANKVLDFYFMRKAAWLREKHKSSPWVGNAAVPQFFKRLVREVDMNAHPIVAAAQLDGVPMAAAICLVGRRAVEFFMTTFEPAYAAYAPGVLLIRYLAEWAIGRRLDFGFGLVAADYKERWPVVVSSYNGSVLFTVKGRLPDPASLIGLARKKASTIKRRFPLFATSKGR